MFLPSALFHVAYYPHVQSCYVKWQTILLFLYFLCERVCGLHACVYSHCVCVCMLLCVGLDVGLCVCVRVRARRSNADVRNLLDAFLLFYLEPTSLNQSHTSQIHTLSSQLLIGNTLFISSRDGTTVTTPYQQIIKWVLGLYLISSPPPCKSRVLTARPSLRSQTFFWTYYYFILSFSLLFCYFSSSTLSWSL